MTASAPETREQARSTSITCSTQMERFSGKVFHLDGTLSAPEVGRKVWFGRTEGSALTDPNLSSDAKAILGILSLKVKGSVAHIGLRELGRFIGSSPQTAMRCIVELVERGDVEIIRGRAGQRSRYRLTAPMFDAKYKQTRAVPEPKPPVICNGCGQERPGLLRSGLCRGCSSRRKLELEVDRSVIKHLGLSA
jgi:hypothetical protein